MMYRLLTNFSILIIVFIDMLYLFSVSGEWTVMDMFCKYSQKLLVTKYSQKLIHSSPVIVSHLLVHSLIYRSVKHMLFYIEIT